MSARKARCVTFVVAILLLGVPAAHVSAARHHRKAVNSQRHNLSWTSIALRHVSPQYVLDALQRGREWHALLHGNRGRSLDGVAEVIPGGRNNTLFVRGTRDGAWQLRQIVGLLDTPPATAQTSTPVGTTDQAYQMVLTGQWQRSIRITRGLLSHSPGNTEAMALQAYSLVKSNRPDEAETLLVRALRQTEGMKGHVRALVLVAAGSFAEAQGNKVQAVSAYQQAGSADSTCALAYLAFADYAHNNGKDATAKKLLQGALDAVQTPAERAAIRTRLGAF